MINHGTTILFESKNNQTTDKYSLLTEHSKLNPRKWWSLIKSVYKNNEIVDSIPPIEVDNEIITDDLEKAGAFNDFCLSASQVDDTHARLPGIDRIYNDGNDLIHINITLQDVADTIPKLCKVIQSRWHFTSTY